MKKLLLLLIVAGLSTNLSVAEHTYETVNLGRIEALNRYFLQTDGVLVFPAVEMLYNELELNPMEWCKVMAGDSAAFKRFLKSLGSAVFVSRDDCHSVEFLESLRVQDLNMLKELQIPQELLGIHEQLVKRLEVIRPRAIQ